MGSERHLAYKLITAAMCLSIALAACGREEAKQDAPTGLPRLIELGADKCKACKEMAPTIEKLREDFQGKVEVVSINVWEDKAAIAKYNVQLIPTQVFLDASGKEVFRHVGAFSREEILAQFKKMGVQFPEGK